MARFIFRALGPGLGDGRARRRDDLVGVVPRRGRDVRRGGEAQELLQRALHVPRRRVAVEDEAGVPHGRGQRDGRVEGLGGCAL